MIGTESTIDIYIFSKWKVTLDLNRKLISVLSFECAVQSVFVEMEIQTRDQFPGLGSGILVIRKAFALRDMLIT